MDLQKNGQDTVIKAFEDKVACGLARCGIDLCRLEDDCFKLGVAVSGGADSVSLLVSLARICSKYDKSSEDWSFCKHVPNKNISLKVITINHNIRCDSESRGDAEFVETLCRKLDAQVCNVSCRTVEIPRNVITEQAAENKSGIEDAARTFRYKAFEKFIDYEGLSALCLAHTQNDQLETSLMRFLQGSDSDSVAVIPSVRGRYVRPLLEITRNEIESYLNALGLDWRTDSTNYDIKYTRNKIRNRLIPFLNEHFEGWQVAVLAGVEKSEMNREVLTELADRIEMFHEADSVFYNRRDFDSALKAVKYQLLLKGLNVLGVKRRIPHAFLSEVIFAFGEYGTESCRNKISDEKNGKIIRKRFSDVEILLKKERILFEKVKKNNTDLVFFDIIEETGDFDFPFGKVRIFSSEETENKGNEPASVCKLEINGEIVEHCFSLPVCIQNFQLDDEIKSADGRMKKINDVFSDWHVSPEMRKQIPLLLELKNNEFVITCILGKTFGFKDWIVYENR